MRKRRRSSGLGGWIGLFLFLLILLAAFWFLFVTGYWAFLFVVWIVGAVVKEAKCLERR